MFVDPELQTLASALPTTELTDVQAAREADASFRSGLESFRPAGLEVHDAAVSVGGRVVPIRVYASDGRNTDTAAIMWIHGGGWAIGDLDTDDARCARLAHDARTTVVSVDYRLAPEHPYPAALEDCHAALTWVLRHAGDLGIAQDRVVVGGASAGANLAVALSQLARDRAEDSIAFLFLLVPVLDDRASADSPAEAPGLKRAQLHTFWRWYLGEQSASALEYAAPLRRNDLAGLPRTYISVAENDPLRDEGIAYARRLIQAGISVELHLFPGTFHASSLLMECQISRRQYDEMKHVLAAEVTRPRTPDTK